MLKPDSTVVLFDHIFSIDTWHHINIACKDYNQSSLLKLQDCFLYLPDSEEYISVQLASFNIDHTCSMKLVFGDPVASFCGYLEKFTLFANSTNFQNVSDGCISNCAVPLGTIEPVCLGPPSTTPSCSSREYLDPVTLKCNGNHSFENFVLFPSFYNRLSYQLHGLQCDSLHRLHYRAFPKNQWPLLSMRIGVYNLYFWGNMHFVSFWLLCWCKWNMRYELLRRLLRRFDRL